jgi:hypothetical protein
MAVEIRELVIRALIVNDAQSENSDGPEAKADIGKDKIIQECVNQVLKIIKQAKNR